MLPARHRRIAVSYVSTTLLRAHLLGPRQAGRGMHRYRTHTCGELRRKHADEEVRLSGWLQNRRHLGGGLFTDLRDHYGIVQLVTRQGGAAFDFLSRIPKESVISVTGKAIARSPQNVNPNIPTGELEVDVSAAEILGECSDLPFNVFPEEQVGEEKRLANRVLDLRLPARRARRIALCRPVCIPGSSTLSRRLLSSINSFL